MKHGKYGVFILGMLLGGAFADGEKGQAIDIKAKPYSMELCYQSKPEGPNVQKKPFGRGYVITRETSYKEHEGEGESLRLGLLLDVVSEAQGLYIPSDLAWNTSERKDEQDLSGLSLSLKDPEGEPFGRLFWVNCEDRNPKKTLLYVLRFDQLPQKACKAVRLSGTMPVAVADKEEKSVDGSLRLKSGESLVFGDIKLILEKFDPDSKNINAQFKIELKNRDYKIEEIELRNKKGNLIDRSEWSKCFKDFNCNLHRTAEAKYTLKELPEEVDVRIRYRDITRVEVPVDVQFGITPGNEKEK